MKCVSSGRASQADTDGGRDARRSTNIVPVPACVRYAIVISHSTAS
jgi:hypothetical protein